MVKEEFRRKAMTLAAFEALPTSEHLVPLFGYHVKMWKVKYPRLSGPPLWYWRPYWIICEENGGESNADTIYYRAVIRVKAGRAEWPKNTATP